jgi:putative endonuclease
MTQYFVYILTNKYNNVLYVGVSNNLIRRVYEHKNKLISGFTSKYNVNKLVYYEVYSSIFDAIKREKEIKGWKREKKIALITSFNPEWKDLYKELI